MEALMSEYLHVIATIDPGDQNTTVFSDAWDMQKYRQVMAVIMVGAFATGGTYDAHLQQAASSSGAWSTLVSSKAITQLTEVGSDDNKQVIINLNAAEVAATTKRWARLSLTASTTQPAAAVVIGTHSRFKEPWTTISYGDLASVDEILA
jgi:hypothetical protein